MGADRCDSLIPVVLVVVVVVVVGGGGGGGGGGRVATISCMSSHLEFLRNETGVVLA